jgi:hypothetical protein
MFDIQVHKATPEEMYSVIPWLVVLLVTMLFVIWASLRKGRDR